MNTVVQEREQYLKDEMGDEWVENLFSSAKEKQDFLTRVGAESKAIDEEKPQEDEDNPEEEKAKKKEAEPVLKDEMGVIIKAIAKELELDELSDYFEGMEKQILLLEAKVKALTKDEDKKLAERISPNASKHHRAWSKRKSQDKENVIEEDDDDEETKELLNAEPQSTFVKISGPGVDPE